jgi:hypothetical protein
VVKLADIIGVIVDLSLNAHVQARADGGGEDVALERVVIRQRHASLNAPHVNHLPLRMVC